MRAVGEQGRIMRERGPGGWGGGEVPGSWVLVS